MLMEMNQQFESAHSVDCQTVLEIIESKLDESLGYLEGDNSKRARKEIAISKEYGSVKQYVAEQMEKPAEAPSI